MTHTNSPISDDRSDAWPLVKPGMPLRRKLALLAIPTVLAVISIPVGIAHAHGVTTSRVASVATAHVARAAVAKHVHAVAPKSAVHSTTPKLAVRTAAAPLEPADTTDGTTDPAETGTDTGHSDEVAGSTVESTVDHQFDGQE
jgi:hypothetical protein